MQDTKTEREAAAGTDGAEGQAEATKELTKQAEATKELTPEESAEGLAGMLHEREVSAEMCLAGLAGKETEESTGGQRNFLGLSASILYRSLRKRNRRTCGRTCQFSAQPTCQIFVSLSRQRAVHGMRAAWSPALSSICSPSEGSVGIKAGHTPTRTHAFKAVFGRASHVARTEKASLRL